MNVQSNEINLQHNSRRNNSPFEVIGPSHIKSLWLGENIQTLKHLGPVMSTNVARLSNHLTQVLVYLGWILQNKKRLMWSKIRISAPLEDKDEKDINTAN